MAAAGEKKISLKYIFRNIVILSIGILFIVVTCQRYWIYNILELETNITTNIQGILTLPVTFKSRLKQHTIYPYVSALENANSSLKVNGIRGPHHAKENVTQSFTATSHRDIANITTETFHYIGKGCYVYSAYFDSRNASLVRVFAMAPRFAPTGIYCWLWYNDTRDPVAREVKILMWNNARFQMRSAMFTCESGNGPGNKTMAPDYISFSHSPKLSTSNGTLRVENIHKRKQRYKFVVCIHGPVRGYNEPIRLVEHVEVHKLFGADFYSIYNLSAGPLLTPYIEYYKKRGQMELHQWPIPHMHTHDGGQLALINDCLYRYMYRAKYIAMVDLDEFIVPKVHLSWDDMLNRSVCGNHAEADFSHAFFHPQLKDTSSINAALKIMEIKVNSGNKVTVSNSKFTAATNNTTNIAPAYNISSTPTTNTKYINEALVTLQGTKKGSTFYCGKRSKFIIMPERIWLGTVHMVQSSMESHCCMETHLGLLHHYRSRKPDPQGVTDKTMHKFEDSILYSVKKVLDEVGIMS